MVRKVKRRKSGIRIFLAIIFMVSLVVIVCKSTIFMLNHLILVNEYDDHSSSPYFPVKVTSTPVNDRIASPTPSLKPEPTVSVSLNELNSPNAILVRIKDDTVLMQKNSEDKIYPASLTKMMTTLVAIENLTDLKEEIELSNAVFEGLYEADASMAGFQPGERVHAIDLLYGVMLPSGAECCIGLADQIAGSEQSFVELMNLKAVELGMNNTHFENTTGLHNENHYTTVKDLSILLSYALQNDTFREIFTSSRHFTSPTNKHPDGITFYSTMFKGLGSENLMDGEIIGGKTGYTDEAGLCLASLAEVGQEEYILISAGADGNHYSEQYNITDALVVYSSIGK